MLEFVIILFRIADDSKKDLSPLLNLHNDSLSFMSLGSILYSFGPVYSIHISLYLLFGFIECSSDWFLVL
jgi:hypothetical protein